MNEPVTAPWDLNISKTDFQRLIAGFEPRDQDDKWRFTVNLKHQISGTITIHISRTGTGIEHYIFFLRPNSDNGGSVEAITYEQSVAGTIHMTEEQAKKQAVMVTRSVLDCDIEALPEYTYEDIHNYPGNKIGAKIQPDGTWVIIREDSDKLER